MIGIGLCGFLLWAAFAPLDKGVASPGSVTVSGNRKTIQSPGSGIISNIAVKEGDKVKAGQVLVQMSQVQAQAQVDSLKIQYYTTLATEGRLLAERDNLDSIKFSDVFNAIKDKPRAAEIIALQQQLLFLADRHYVVRLMVSDSQLMVYVSSLRAYRIPGRTNKFS